MDVAFQTSDSRLSGPARCRPPWGRERDASFATTLLASREGDRAEQRIFRLARVESGVLHDNRHIGLDETGKISIDRNRSRVGQIVETHMFGSFCRNEQPIWADRRLVRIENSNRDVGVMLARV